MKHLLLGDEAIAQGAIDAGLSGVYAYPGTPSTEITEYIQLGEKRKGDEAKGMIFCQWATNEKTAMEGALGMSYMGKRAMVCMKHVGMNVCADAFMNAAITGVNGGLVVVAADDPSMHSSQNEQDSRFYAKFAMIPCLEPSNQQEAYDMMHYAFDLSEALKTPILMRVTTRMAHSRAVVELIDTPREQNTASAPENVQHFILLPAFARKNYAELVEAQDDFISTSEQSHFNSYTKGTNPKKAILTTGIAYNYLMEAKPNLEETVLKVTQYPLPKALIDQMVADGAEEILVMEEGQPVVEELIRGMVPSSVAVKGRLTGDLPRMGELTPDCVSLALSPDSLIASSPLNLSIYPSAVCAHFSMTYGRCFSCRQKKRLFSSRHAVSSTPTTTSMPASCIILTPRPATCGLGSNVPTTTLPMPLRIINSAQGGVLP